MALSFDFKLGVLAALFLFGAWASQASARTLEETSMSERHKAKPFKIIKENVKFEDRPPKPLKKYPYKSDTGTDNGSDSEIETATTTATPARTTTTPASAGDSSPAQTTSTSIPESLNQINNRAKLTDSVVQSISQNCEKKHRFMDGWSPLVIGAVLFFLLQPGLLFQCPGDNRNVEFKSKKTSRKAMFNHTMIFIAIYAVIIAIFHAKI